MIQPFCSIPQAGVAVLEAQLGPVLHEEVSSVGYEAVMLPFLVHVATMVMAPVVVSVPSVMIPMVVPLHTHPYALVGVAWHCILSW